MDQDKVSANVNSPMRGDGSPPMWDLLRQAEGSCHQAQEWIRQAVKVLGEGHHMLGLPESPPSPEGTVSPFPATVVMIPSSPTRRTRLFPASAM